MQYSTEFCHMRSTNRHRKELDNIKIPPKNKFNHTPTQLKNLLMAAQRFEQPAIDKLCADFTPLINKEAHRQSVFNALGEDAVNIAWEIFLEQIKKYDGRDFGHLPGLLQYHVHFGLLHKFTRGKSVKDCYYLDAEEEGDGMQIADEKNDIDQLVHNQLLSEAMKKLTDAQRNIIKTVFFEDKTMQSYCKKYGITKQSGYVHKERALKKIKQVLVS